MIVWIDRMMREWAAWEIRSLDRARGFRDSPLASVGDRLMPRAPRVPGNARIDDGTNYRLIRQAVRELSPPRLREAIVDYYATGCVGRRTAERMDVDERTIRNWRAAAHDQVRRVLLAHQPGLQRQAFERQSVPKGSD